MKITREYFNIFGVSCFPNYFYIRLFTHIDSISYSIVHFSAEQHGSCPTCRTIIAKGSLKKVYLSFERFDYRYEELEKNNQKLQNELEKLKQEIQKKKEVQIREKRDVLILPKKRAIKRVCIKYGMRYKGLVKNIESIYSITESRFSTNCLCETYTVSSMCQRIAQSS